MPFGSRVIVGILVSLHTTDVPKEKLRRAHAVLDHDPRTPDSLLKLVQWTANYYHHPLGDTMTQALPALLRQGYDLANEVQTFWQARTTAG